MDLAMLLLLLLGLLTAAAPIHATNTQQHKTNNAPAIYDSDFAFDNNDELQVELGLNHKQNDEDCSVKRLWGVPDMPAYVGRMFQLHIPKEAFSGKVTGYEVVGSEGTLPSWLWLDSRHGVLRGIPGPYDRGEHRLVVTALSNQFKKSHCERAIDVFTIEVKDKRESPLITSYGDHQCHIGDDETRLVIIVGRPFHQITPKQRLNAIIKISKFMGLDHNAFLIQPHEVSEDKGISHDEILMSGSIGGKKKHFKASSEIELTVGCNGILWNKHSIIVHQMKQQLIDGTVSDVINLPVSGWKVVRHKQKPLLRKQRQVAEGSTYDDGEVDDEDYNSGYEDEYDYEITDNAEEDYLVTDSYEDYYYEIANITEVDPAPPITSTSPAPHPPPTPPHHHRHHHGETLTSLPKEPTTPKADTFDFPTFININVTPETEDDSLDKEVERLTVGPTLFSTVTEYTTPIQTVQTMATSPAPVDIPLPESEIFPTDKVTTLDGTPQMETEASSTPLPSPRTEAPVTVGYDYSSRSTFATHTTPTIEDTTTYTTIAITEQNKNEQITPQATNKTEEDNFIEKPIDRKHSEPTYNEPVKIIPLVDNTTEEENRKLYEGTLPSIIPDDTLTHDSRHLTSPSEPEKDVTEVSISSSKITDDSSFDIFALPTAKHTTVVDMTTTERSSTVIGRTTETVEFPVPANSPPQKQHRTKKVAVTAGKYFSYIIPEDLFIDAEDGTNLQLAMYDIEHSPLKSSSWVQFDPKTREVYGLPLEEHVSKWEYVIEATDSNGANVMDTLDITVQQHKGRRSVNHEFSMKLRILKKYRAVVDWQIKALKGLVSLFRYTDMDQITVREVDLESDPLLFVWTNDTLPRNSCPKEDIDHLMGILQSSPEGDPSPGLVSAMSPELRIVSVAWKGAGACQAPPTPPVPQPPHHPDNFGPMPRNQIDHINATAGKLLVFKVPEDTFYDPEDGSARNLKMWLTKGDRSPLSPHNWLQFDSKNQEFFGLPMDKDVGRKDYQLVCEDSGGLTANDGLLVEVHAGPSIKPPVEFQMTLDTPYETFVQSASTKRKFIEKLQRLFGDSDTSLIKIKSISYRPTVISWYNVSLPNDRCPEEEMKQLRNVLVGSDGSVTERADVIMGADFPVMSVSLVTRGACSMGGPIIHIPEIPPNLAGPNDDAAKTVNSDDYLITFIVPIVVIVCMIFIAALIACILYKRRRTGKMNVGDDEERQAFRSKGIPVIFQDELDEKPDPSNKSPVIMKEEKPPLLPPPEYKGMDSNSPTPSHTPYHPPPPFTASRESARNNRPKPTPTYRKPPPYVPP